MSVTRIGDFTITEFVDVAVYCPGSGLLDYLLEDLQDFKLNYAQDDSDITGRNGRKIGKKKKSKSSDGSGTSGLVSPGLMHTQTGGSIEHGEFKVKREESKIVSGKATTIATDAVAVGAAGKEIGQIKIFGKGGVLVAVFEQGTVADTEEFSYDPATKTITLPDNDLIEAGMKAVYSYYRIVTATHINNPSDKFSKTRELWIHCYATDRCDTIYRADCHVARADFKGDFELDLGSDQTTHNFSFDCLPDFCGTDGGDLNEWFFYKDDEVPVDEDDCSAVGTSGSSGGISTIATAASDAEVKNIFTS